MKHKSKKIILIFRDNLTFTVNYINVIYDTENIGQYSVSSELSHKEMVSCTMTRTWYKSMGIK